MLHARGRVRTVKNRSRIAVTLGQHSAASNSTKGYERMPVKIAFSKQLEVDGVADFRRCASLPISFTVLWLKYELCSVNATEAVLFWPLNSDSERPECVIKTDEHVEEMAEWRVWWPSYAIAPSYALNSCADVWAGMNPMNCQIRSNLFKADFERFEHTNFLSKYLKSECRRPDTSCISFAVFFFLGW